ncbi:hypothetical protein GPECTOR_11g248 [Gonium pectorale]|uniref:BACK domain-containing protein n=1 Tax=Gonium pectorale TaxID=33097 RepID=A0A150GPM0_GONPE|nr:hypothetical protein GPECTOR_11g248 [Gonium pectorale]|eukprot:KXZ51806.1 hypothetical protein GPECTOR_11g248 [Gonium pectorale]
MTGREAELPGARAAIRFAYTGEVAADSVREALEVLRQAAYLGIEGCGAACLQLLLSMLALAVPEVSVSKPSADGQSSGGFPYPHVLELWECRERWPDPLEEPGFAAVLAFATRQLLAHFGDALAVLNSRSLLAHILGLPASALEALLESDDFGTDTESSVLLLLAEWMAVNHDRTTAATRERLCQRVRLVQLSRPYLHSVLLPLAAEYEVRVALEAAELAAPAPSSPPFPACPSFPGSPTSSSPLISRSSSCVSSPSSPRTPATPAPPSSTSSSPRPPPLPGWFPITVTEASFITGLAGASDQERRKLNEEAGDVYDLSLPWYSSRPRRQCLPPEGRTYEWELPSRDLERALSAIKPGEQLGLQGASLAGGPAVYFAGGFAWETFIFLEAGAAPSAPVASMMAVECALPASVARPCPRHKVMAAPSISARLALHHWRNGVRQEECMCYRSTTHVATGTSTGKALQHLRLLPAAPPGAAALGAGGAGGRRVDAWEAYLHEGRMSGAFTLLPPQPAPQPAAAAFSKLW